MAPSAQNKMAINRTDEGNSAMSRASKPTLTVDTRVTSKNSPAGESAQSAPVGTRQEKGFPPMYQAVDRHCAKLAEIMNSPTWRSQNPGPHVRQNATLRYPGQGYNHVQSPLAANCDDMTRSHRRKNKTRGSDAIAQAAQSSAYGQSSSDRIHLGIGSEPIKILGIHPFPETAETSSNTVLISAAVSSGSREPGTSFQEMQPSSISFRRHAVQIKSEDELRAPEEAREEAHMSDHAEASQNSSRSVSSSSDIRAAWEAENQQVDDDFHKLVKQDQAIQSVVNRTLRSPNRRKEASLGEKERFKGLLDRLHHQYPKSDAVSLDDPAIISYVPKKVDQGTPTKRSKHSRSDSGYVSPSATSKPSTRDQSRISRGNSDSFESEAFCIQHEKDGSKDSGFETPSTNSTLNPAAREFSTAKPGGGFPPKSGAVARPPVHYQPFLPPQQHQPPAGCVSPTKFGQAPQPSPGPWFPALGNANAMMSFSPMPQVPWQQAPGSLPHAGNFASPALPPLPCVSPPRLAPFLGCPPGPPTSLGSPLALGTPGLSPVPSLATPGLAPPFHQQLPDFSTCNNPAHQQAVTLGSQALSGSSSLGFIPQNSVVPTHGPVAPTPAFGGPFIPKHVPKPKVPNTTGQQNWELVHEMRRMNEPGYAQKCKEKQKKRFIKQLGKSGGSMTGED